jgi:aldehyde dehydrogenase (NAD+)
MAMGPLAGQAISGHRHIDMVSLTGLTGILVAKAAANSVKRVMQESGSKSTDTILPEARLSTPGGTPAFWKARTRCTAPAGVSSDG